MYKGWGNYRPTTVARIMVLSFTDVVKPQVDRTRALIAIKAGELNQRSKCISEFIQEGLHTIVTIE